MRASAGSSIKGVGTAGDVKGAAGSRFASPSTAAALARDAASAPADAADAGGSGDDAAASEDDQPAAAPASAVLDGAAQPLAIADPSQNVAGASSEQAPDPGAGGAAAANLAAQMAQKLSGQSTRFDLQLDPAGLGRVDVAVQIDAQGGLTASLSFEKPEAASLLRAHAGDLQQSLAQAGFDVSNAAFSFSSAAAPAGSGGAGFFAGGGFGEGAGQGGQNPGGRVFSLASLAADQTDQAAVASQGLAARGLDIRI